MLWRTLDCSLCRVRGLTGHATDRPRSASKAACEQPRAVPRAGTGPCLIKPASSIRQSPQRGCRPLAMEAAHKGPSRANLTQDTRALGCARSAEMAVGRHFKDQARIDLKPRKHAYLPLFCDTPPRDEGRTNGDEPHRARQARQRGSPLLSTSPGEISGRVEQGVELFRRRHGRRSPLAKYQWWGHALISRG